MRKLGAKSRSHLKMTGIGYTQKTPYLPKAMVMEHGIEPPFLSTGSQGVATWA